MCINSSFHLIISWLSFYFKLLNKKYNLLIVLNAEFVVHINRLEIYLHYKDINITVIHMKYVVI